MPAEMSPLEPAAAPPASAVVRPPRRLAPAPALRPRRRRRRRGRARGGGGRGRGRARGGRVAQMQEQQLVEHRHRPDRQQRGERLVGLLELGAERAAALAAAQVAADERAGPALEPFGDLGELDPDLVAGEQAGLGGLGQGDARADEQRLHAGDGRLHRLGDLLIGQGVHLAQDERGLLGLGQLVDVADQQPELLALVDLVRGGGAVLGEVVVHRVHADRLGAAQVVEAAVARDPVQPRADVDRPVVGEDRVEGRGHDLLEHVLGVLARAEQVAAERHQPRLVRRHQHLEGGGVAPAQERDQPLVGLKAQQRGPPVQSDSARVFQR